MIAPLPCHFSPDDIDPVHHRQGVAEIGAGPIGQARRHQRMRHRHERRLGGEADDVVVQRRRLDLLAGRPFEADDPAIDQLLAALVKFRVLTAKLRLRGLGLGNRAARGKGLQQHGEQQKAT